MSPQQRQSSRQRTPTLAHTPRPHPPVEEPEEQPDEHAPETEPDDDELETPSDPGQKPTRPGKQFDALLAARTRITG